LFFWIDAFVCPLSTPWFNGTSVVKDPLPLDEAVDLPCVELLNENRTLIRKYPETFLCLMGLSHSFIETDVYLTFLCDNDEEIGLLDFVKSTDPFKVKVGEQNLTDNEVPLKTEIEDRVISPSPQTISLVIIPFKTS
nr:transposase (putative), gypsy type [Tanacetum cinerariifolium]